jgi:2-succinyl-5-enolpyruvyl-6-hydroxy-3-cyclohexene-1-carboxylate synthase
LAKLILVGQLPVNNNLSKQLRRLAADGSVVVMVESTSNLKDEDFVGCIDTVIEGLNPETEAALCPEILVTLGGAIVSKRIKTLLRKINPAHHWHVSPDVEGFHVDTFRSLSLTLPVDSPGFLDQLAGLSLLTKSTFAANWKQRMKERLQKHSIFLKSAPFSDIKAYELIFNQLPENGILFLGNSTPVRYGQLFNELNGYPIQSNRGTSGIDGCVSTAAGTAMLCDQTVTVITGDISFFYDSNALWNKALPANLKIIMINNGGGNIFRVIPGPDQFEELGPYIETAHQLTGEDLARGFGLNYLKANDEPELNQALKQMHHYDNRAILLEIVTPNKLSAQVLKDYFKFIAS